MTYLFLTLDLGTRGCKCGVINEKGELIANSFFKYPVFSPRPGWIEQDPTLYWVAVKETVRDCLKQIKEKRNNIVSITVTGQDQTLVVVDRNGKTLRNAMIWMDNRSHKESNYIKKALGMFFPSTFNLPKLLWLKNNEPKTFSKIYKALSCKGYVYYKLTGRFAVDFHFEDLLYILEKREWDSEKLSTLGIPNDIMPELFISGEIIGYILPEVARELNLPKNIPIIAGGPYDTDVGKVGLGLVKPGDAGIIGGTSASYSILVEEKIKDPKNRVLGKPNGINHKLWEVEAIMSTAGGAFEWFVNNFFLGSEEERYNAAIKEAHEVSAGSNNLLFLPHLSGERSPYWCDVPKGAFIGITLSHSRKHFSRAVLEGIAFMFRLYTEIFEEMGIDKPKIIKFGGGMAKNTLWLHIISDVLDATLQVPMIITAELIGGAIIASVTLNVYKDLPTAAENMVKIKEEIIPSTNNKQTYDKSYKTFKKLYPALEPIFLTM